MDMHVLLGQTSADSDVIEVRTDECMRFIHLTGEPVISFNADGSMTIRIMHGNLYISPIAGNAITIGVKS
jgi:hypothetical protein